MAPVVKSFQEKSDFFEAKVCVTAQHREMLDQVLDFFAIKPDYDLDVMQQNQSLQQLTSRMLSKMEAVFKDFDPNYVFVHGDTTTAMVASLGAFYHGAKVCHVEAGLRTNNKLAPFPEEINRQIIGRITDYHFAPTQLAKENLLKENIDENSIFVTGNTVIDSLLFSVDKVKREPSNYILKLKSEIENKNVILVTGHRRENHGEGFKRICKALKRLAIEFNEVLIIYPVHLNPNVQAIVNEELSDIQNIMLIKPMSYPDFVWLMNSSKIILTDSGGVQEEAPSLDKPVLVMRDVTERPEAIKIGTAKLVGTDEGLIYLSLKRLLKDEGLYQEFSQKKNPYGDGKAAIKIVDFLINVLKEK